MFRQYAAWRVSISRRAPSGYCAVVHLGTALVCGFSVCAAGLCHVVWQVRGMLTCLPRGCRGDGSVRCLRLRCLRAWEMPRSHAVLLPCGRSPAEPSRVLSPDLDISGVAQSCGFSVCAAGLCHVVWQVRGVPTCLPRGAVAMGRCGASGCDVSERDVNAPILRSEGLSRHQQDALLPCPTPMSADGDRAGLVGTSAQDSTPYADG